MGEPELTTSAVNQASLRSLILLLVDNIAPHVAQPQQAE